MKTVYVIGVFDLFHSGHVNLLRKARSLGDRLVVAINGDDMVTSYKRKPYISENDRLAVVLSCRYVDDAFIIRGFDNKEAIIKYNVNIIVHGDDWTGDSYLRQIRLTEDFVKEHDISFEYVPYTQGISTSDIINKIKLSKDVL